MEDLGDRRRQGAAVRQCPSTPGKRCWFLSIIYRTVHQAAYRHQPRVVPRIVKKGIVRVPGLYVRAMHC